MSDDQRSDAVDQKIDEAQEDAEEVLPEKRDEKELRLNDLPEGPAQPIA